MNHLSSSESAVRALLVSGDPPTIEQLSQSLQEFGSLDQSLHRYSKRHPPREHSKVRDGGGRPQIRRAEQVGSRTGASLAIQSHDSGICDHPERKRIGLPVISPPKLRTGGDGALDNALYFLNLLEVMSRQKTKAAAA